MSRNIKSTAEKVQPKHNNFSWAFINVPENIMNAHSLVVKKINKDDLYIEKTEKNGDWSFGIEDNVHITVKYGFDFNDPQPAINVLIGENGGNVEISTVEIFKQDNYEVLVVRVKSKVLNNLHDKLTKALNIYDSYPEYSPHITIAYFKRGRAYRYMDISRKAFVNCDLDFCFDELIFEDTKNHQTKISLK